MSGDPTEAAISDAPATSTDATTILPRAKRRRRRDRVDRGLPEIDQLRQLAREYLEQQRRHWPELAEQGLLPEVTDAQIDQMVELFQESHRTGRVPEQELAPLASIRHKLGGFYGRYSCDNSSPTSVLDQMTNVLRTARAEERFIPWSYVFADFSVSGLDSSRQGYSSYKSLMISPDHQIETTYIDDFTRASRDELEWWKLAQQAKFHRKRLIGASDGFDLNSPHGEMMVSMFGMLSRMFIKGLREKVGRGMRGGARRNACLGKPPLGFTRRVGADGKNELCIDPETSLIVQRLHEMYLDQRMSPYQISQTFNAEKVDDWNGWTGTGIRKVLDNPANIGAFIWNRFRWEKDWESEKRVKIENPRSEWERSYRRELALISIEIWRATKKRLASTKRKRSTGKRTLSRNQARATTLFSGTLVCGYCEREITLARSTGKYKVMHCTNGMAGAHDCRLSSSKSTRIIEDCLLGFIRDSLLNEGAVRQLVARANEFLQQEADRPRVDTSNLCRQRNDVTRKIEKLLSQVEDEEDEPLCQSYHQRIKQHQRTLNTLKGEIRNAETQNRRPPPPLDVDQTRAYLEKLRDLLNKDIPVAADAIRALTGPIEIRQEPIPGKKRGGVWIAKFRPNFVKLIRHVTQNADYPDSATLAYLRSRNWTIPEAVTVRVDKVPKYEKLAPKFQELARKGTSISTIAAAHGVTRMYANQVLTFAERGKRPVGTSRKRTGRGPRYKHCYKEIAPRVAELRDIEKLSWRLIRERLAAEGITVSEGTIRRAWDYQHPEALRTAIEKATGPDRGTACRLGVDTFEEIRRRIGLGLAPKEIAAAVGCSASTVCSVRREMRRAG